jgi:hypothetical protein
MATDSATNSAALGVVANIFSAPSQQKTYLTTDINVGILWWQIKLYDLHQSQIPVR